MTKPEKQHCLACGQVISQRQIALFAGLVFAAWKVWWWCKLKDVKVFNRKQVKHLFQSENVSARFGDLILFGLLERPVGCGKGWFVFRQEFAEKFFAGKTTIPTIIWKDPIANSMHFDQFRSVDHIPDLMGLLNADGEYVANYRDGQAQLPI